MESTKRRSYRMKTRAQAQLATQERILRAALRLFSEWPYEVVSFERIAEDAHVSVQTVIRHFGSKEQLFHAATRQGLEEACGARITPPGDVVAAVEQIVAHYERWGDLIQHLLLQREHVLNVGPTLEEGRRAHVQWVERTFAPLLANLSEPLQRRRRAQLLAITDISTLRILRRDLSLSPQETKEALQEMIMVLF